MAATPLTVPPAAPAVPPRGPDLRALRVAQWVQARVPDGDVYLFGSRARGDWEAASDIDLMVVVPEPLPADAVSALDAAAREARGRLYGARTPGPVQVLSMTRTEFDWARTSPNHVAGGVQRDGLDPGGQPLPPITQDNPWPAVRQHLRATHRNLYDALQSAGIGVDRLAIAEAHNALENVLKAYASACGVEYKRSPWLDELLAQIPSAHEEAALPSTDWLRDLSRFRAQHAYTLEPPAPPGTAAEIREEVQALCRLLAARALALCNKLPRQVGYPQYAYAPWDLGQPLAGMEMAHPPVFRRIDFREAEALRRAAAESRQAAAEFRRAAAESRRAALEHVAGLYHTAAAVAEFVRYLDWTPPADWPALKDVNESPLPRLPGTDEDTGEDGDPDKGGGR